jgi:hypothetical protein
MKRDYKQYDTVSDEELEECAGVVEGLVATTAEMMEGVTPYEKKAIRELKEKLLGRKKGNIPEYNAILLHVAMWVIPRFEHTRTVNISRMTNGDVVLVCSCPLWEKYGWACRHMYKVMERRPTVRDAKVRWQVGYANDYGINESTTSQYLHMRDNLAYPGVPIAEDLRKIKTGTTVGYGERPLEYFTSSLGKLRLRGGVDGNYWSTVAHKFSGNVQACFPCAQDDDIESNVSISNASMSGVKQEPAAAGFAREQQVAASSSYAVPSQSHPTCNPPMIDLTNSNDESEEASANSTFDGACQQGNSAYHDFMPMYRDLCKQADSKSVHGTHCWKLMKKHMSACKKEMFSHDVSEHEGSGIASHPVIATGKKVAHRKKKATSPLKNKNKRRTK